MCVGLRKCAPNVLTRGCEDLRLTISYISECHHVCNLSPSVFACPTSSTTSIRVYRNIRDAVSIRRWTFIFIAKEAYGLVPLKGSNAIEPSVLNPNTRTKSDPLGQRGYVGWKAYFVAVRLNESWMARLEVGATDV